MLKFYQQNVHNINVAKICRFLLFSLILEINYYSASA